MRVFVSADIEGTAGITVWDEANPGHPDYAYFREQMTREVAAACEGAVTAGAADVVVRDAHWNARNLDPSALPLSVRLIRGHTGDLYTMLSGMQCQPFDACMMTGYHSAAGTDANPLAHTFSSKTYEYILLNGELLSEFRYNAYMAATLNVPVVFISGDEGICREAETLIPGITTVVTNVGRGAGTMSIHPRLAVQRIRESVQIALSGDSSLCHIALPKTFTLTVRYRDHSAAHAKSYYPGASMDGAKTIVYTSSSFYEIQRAVRFIL